MTRAFVAIRPPEEVLDAVEARIATVVMPGGRKTSRDQWHLTLQFLGDDVGVDAVIAAFAREPLDTGPGEIALGGAEALGDPTRSRILALGLRDGTWIRELAARVERRLATLGHTRSDQEPAFLPHLTLARFREPTDLRPLCAAIGSEAVGPAWSVEDIVLFETVLAREGVRHAARANFSLGP